MFIALLTSVRQTRKSFRNARTVRISEGKRIDEVIRNAMGWAWEIGNGQEMREILSTSSANPFLQSNWRNGVKQ